MGGLNLKETESVSPLFLLNYSKLKYRTDFKLSQSFWWEFSVSTMKKKIFQRVFFFVFFFFAMVHFGLKEWI